MNKKVYLGEFSQFVGDYALWDVLSPRAKRTNPYLHLPLPTLILYITEREP
jgi:hypothetical protein